MIGLILLTPAFAQTPQQIHWDFPVPGVPLVIGRPQPLTASANSGLPVTFRVERGPALISGGTITATNVGTIRVIAEQAGDANYAPSSIARTWNETEIEGAVVASLDRSGKVRVDGKFLYVAGNGLDVFEIQDPEHPVFRGRIDFGEIIRDLVPIERHVLVVVSNRLGVVDVSRPEQPTLIGSLELGAPAGALAVEGKLAGVTQGTGFAVVDWSQPEAPVLRANVSIPEWFTVTDITLRHGMAYVAGPTFPVTVYDLGLPIPQPRIEGAEVWGPDCRLAADDQSLFAARWYDFGVMKLSHELESPATIGL
ncbi:MAG TPA: hypothetical protein DCE44_17140, partial [Verrucomicrobiales bacterium]|nr:hypothetical protein [Verrucomicrobiales bacterium]